jgi:hypothetical protein
MNVLVLQGLGMSGGEDAANGDDLRNKASRETSAGPTLVWGLICFHHLLPS